MKTFQNRIPFNFVLFVIAFGFAHLLHQQILPFNQQSFPYPILEENQDSKCWNENPKTKFEQFLQKISNNEFGKLTQRFTISSDIYLIKLQNLICFETKPFEFYWGRVGRPKPEGWINKNQKANNQYNILIIRPNNSKHILDQLFTVDTIWNIEETGDIYIIYKAVIVPIYWNCFYDLFIV